MKRENLGSAPALAREFRGDDAFGEPGARSERRAAWY